MTDQKGAYLWPSKEWDKFQAVLSSADAAFLGVSKESGLVLLKNIQSHGADWPARRLRKSTLFSFSEIRLLLNPAFLEDNNVYYILDMVKFKKVLGLFRSFLGSKVLAQYSEAQIKDPAFMKAELKKAVGTLE